MEADKDLIETKRDMLKNLFAVSQAGNLDLYLRYYARSYIKKMPGVMAGNVVQAGELFSLIAYMREKAAVALPDGTELAIPRVELERRFGPQKWTKGK
jgi:hypothetical protein